MCLFVVMFFTATSPAVSVSKIKYFLKNWFNNEKKKRNLPTPQLIIRKCSWSTCYQTAENQSCLIVSVLPLDTSADFFFSTNSNKPELTPEPFVVSAFIPPTPTPLNNGQPGRNSTKPRGLVARWLWTPGNGWEVPKGLGGCSRRTSPRWSPWCATRGSCTDVARCTWEITHKTTWKCVQCKRCSSSPAPWIFVPFERVSSK